MSVISGGSVITGGEADVRFIKAPYSFAVNGGAVSTIPLLTSNDIPQGAIILGGFVDVTSAPTSGGSATIAVRVEAANDIITAAAFDGAPWSTTGRKSIIPAFTGATTVKTTAPRGVSVVIGAAALTAGTFDVYLFIVMP